MDLIEYRAPGLVAGQVAAHFGGERQAAAVLDVACGTGMAAKMVRTALGANGARCGLSSPSADLKHAGVAQMKREGFQRFVGVDGSERMLQHARESGLYQDLKMAVLGEQPIPVASGDRPSGRPSVRPSVA